MKDSVEPSGLAHQDAAPVILVLERDPLIAEDIIGSLGAVCDCRVVRASQLEEFLAKLVEEAVSGSRIEISQQVGADRRCYRVRCDRIAEELPHFRPAWTVKSGIEQLLEVLRRQPLSSEDFEGSRFDRKAHLLQLLELVGRIVDR